MKTHLLSINRHAQSATATNPVNCLRTSLFMLAMMLFSSGINSVYAVDYINTPLDPTNPVEFYGDYIVYGGQTITLGPNALYVDGSLSTTAISAYEYVFNEVDDDKANVKALRPYVNANKAAGTAANPVKVYFAPWVYWTDNPDDLTISSSSGETNRHGLDGAVLNVNYIEFIGLTSNRSNVILCGNRGQSNGSNGNWNVFSLTASSFYTENITYGNYCTVDLVFPLKPELNRVRRTNNGVQAQLFGFSAINGKVWAKNCAFVSRLNLTPPAGSRTLYTNCHFESTDDSLMKGVYLNCDFDFYGSMPFGGINGAVLLNSIFRSQSTSGVQYITKGKSSGVNIDGNYICVDAGGNPINSKAIEWTKVPPKYLRAYQSNITLNGTVQVDMSGDVPGLAVDITGKDALKAYKIIDGETTVYNTYNLLRGTDSWDPLGVKTIIETAGADNVPTALTINSNSPTITTGGSVTLTSSVAGSTTDSQSNAGDITWAIAPDYVQYSSNIVLEPATNGKTCKVTGTNETYAPIYVVITATSTIGLQGASYVRINPAQQEAPAFSVQPAIIAPADGKIGIAYTLDLPDPVLNDWSVITWYRLDANSWDDPTAVSISRLNVPELFYQLEPGDVGKYIGVEIKPKHDVSATGTATRIIYGTQIASTDVVTPFEIHTDFRNLPLDYLSAIKPGYWTVRNASLTSAQLTDWKKDGYQGTEAAANTTHSPSATVSGWTFTDAAQDGGASTEDEYKYGLFFNSKGAQLFYTPVATSDYTQIKINLNPEKSAGQGFGSAGQWIDIFIKFDLATMQGYALRLMRISQGGKSVMFYLVQYKADGTVVPICTPVWSSAMISDCFITLTADNATGKLTAHVESTKPQTSGAIDEWAGHLSHAVVNMEADMTANTYGGFGIFDLGSNSAGNRHLFRSLDVIWTRKYNVLVGTAAGGNIVADKTESIGTGETVTLSIETASDYTLESITAYKTGEQETIVALAGEGDTRTFVMPAYNVSIEAVFTQITGTLNIVGDDPVIATQYYNVQGMQLNSKPNYLGVYIVKETHQSGKITKKKILSITK
ncbi:MAG: hypothetical protein LBV75_03300 [Paludibacter sp.]|jgi:hypothetical protein|nr:hypothetical protein [Paludibacter sp.]